MISSAREAFDETGLVDPKAREIVAAQMAAFAAWIGRLSPAPQPAPDDAGGR